MAKRQNSFTGLLFYKSVVPLYFFTNTVQGLIQLFIKSHEIERNWSVGCRPSTFTTENVQCKIVKSIKNIFPVRIPKLTKTGSPVCNRPMNCFVSISKPTRPRVSILLTAYLWKNKTETKVRII